jgi:hypothetical protein
MSLLRLPLVIGAAASWHICTTAPAQSAKNERIIASSNELFLSGAVKVGSLIQVWEIIQKKTKPLLTICL